MSPAQRVVEAPDAEGEVSDGTGFASASGHRGSLVMTRRAVESDICIIGSGISAAMVADKLARLTQKSIVVVEAGDDVIPMKARDTARERYLDSPQIARILNNVERTTATLDKNLEPLLSDGRATLADAKKLTHALASDCHRSGSCTSWVKPEK